MWLERFILTYVLCLSSNTNLVTNFQSDLNYNLSYILQEAHKMANDAKTILTNRLAKSNIQVPPITIEAYREDRAMAIGNGSGIK